VRCAWVAAHAVQVESERLGISPDEPIAAVQYNMLIAVNYPARAYKIGRKWTRWRRRNKNVHIFGSGW